MSVPSKNLLAPVLAIGATVTCSLGLFAADSPESLATERAEVQKTFPEAFAAVLDDATLPRVLLIGDSISIGYTPFVREALAGRANVHRIPDNGGPTSRGLMLLPEWLGSTHWDVIHFNFGLHDLKRNDYDQVQVPLADYERNLRMLVAGLRGTGAKLVFATTTPVPGRTSNRRQEDVLAYNAAAWRVMRELDVPVNDLHAVALPRLAVIQLPANVHYTRDGYRELAEPVTAAIRAQLNLTAPPSAP